jgi:hypothetical protein
MREKDYLNGNDELLVESGDEPDNYREYNLSIFYLLEDDTLLERIVRPYAIKYLLSHFLDITQAEVRDFINQTAYIG